LWHVDELMRSCLKAEWWKKDKFFYMLGV
jgi:hypothetical protein